MKSETVMVRTEFNELAGAYIHEWTTLPPAIWFAPNDYPAEVALVRGRGYRFLERRYDRFDEIWVRPFPRWLIHMAGHQVWSGYHAVRRWLYRHRILNVRNDWSWKDRTVRLTDLRLWPFGKRVP